MTAKFYSILLNEIHLFYDVSGRTCKILFANDNRTRQHIFKSLKYI